MGWDPFINLIVGEITMSFITKLNNAFTTVLNTVGIDEQATTAIKNTGSDLQNFTSETVTTSAYLIGSVTRSASTLATATRMGSEKLYNTLPSDREAVETGISTISAMLSAELSETDFTDTQPVEKSAKKPFGKVQATEDIS
ncbi:hypothetical protein vBAmePPT11V19_00088 [Alteromonas phage vB_AmeP_PT11-V19]|nr:hypothetical protein vBAmePPT11V19_00088 [Alteromonas phage vB_AmeP_PT11-V19]